jgi:hypothetical protein
LFHSKNICPLLFLNIYPLLFLKEGEGAYIFLMKQVPVIVLSQNKLRH